MSDVFGIDLGTTNSAVAEFDGELAKIIDNSEGDHTTPSVVYFETESNVVVGDEAKNGSVLYPDNTVSLIKRQMGTSFTKRYFDVDHTPESISALILDRLVGNANAQNGTSVTKVVITVPAYFGVLEKDATRKAGEIAGLDVLAIIPEPLAAALAYGFTRQGSRKTIFVYDLGGGTFDTTVLSIGEGSLDTAVIGGDSELGGANWDERLFEHVASEFIRLTGASEECLEDDEFIQDLLLKTETLKKQLSQKETGKIIAAWGTERAGIEVTRATFEELTADLLDRTVQIVDRTLSDLREKDPALVIDEVLLVGGSSKMPAVQRRVHEVFGIEPKLFEPDTSVAKGAAIFGAMNEPEPIGDGTDRSDDADAAPRPFGVRPAQVAMNTVLPKSLGIRVVADRTRPDDEIISFFADRNSSLPINRHEVGVATVQHGQRSVAIRIYEQSGEVASPAIDDNREITPPTGAVMSGLPDGLPAGSPITIVLSIDTEGLVQLEATEPTSGLRLEVEVKVETLSQEKVDELSESVGKISVR